MSTRITAVEPDGVSQRVRVEGVYTVGPRLTQSSVTALALLCRKLPGGTPVCVRLGDRRLPIGGVQLERVPTDDGPAWALVLIPAGAIRSSSGEERREAKADGPALLSLPEARERLRVSKATLDRLISRGDIARVKIGRRCFIDAAEINRFITESGRREGDE
ncbi:helix-turn-helix domain-containing protein [Mycolicibacterium fortuitum]